MNKLLFAFCLAAGSAFAVDLHLAGDSTLAPRKPEANIASWGDALRPFLKEGNAIRNYAVSGTSTVTFRPIWDKSLIGKVKEGDFVIIQFGHNDPWHTEKKYMKPGGLDRFCTPEQYHDNLTKFIDEVKAKKAIPVLMTPTPTWHFDKKTGEWTGVRKNHQPYFAQVPVVAKETGVCFVDMTDFGNKALMKEGAEKCKAYFGMYFDGGKDDVHPSKAGAKLLADLFLKHVRERKLPVAELFR